MMMSIIIKSLLFLLVAPGTVLVLIPCLLLRSDVLTISISLGAYRWLGLILALPGLAILLWSFWAFAFIGRGTPAPTDPPKRFVAEGLYRYVRNPMYVGVFLVLLGEACLLQSPVLIVYSLLVFLAFHLFVVVYEEPRLRIRFGDSYTRYLQGVPRWLPRRQGTVPPISDLDQAH
jgi:protein-S-isoprenylcysteine O-methyltransferase Ste14